MTYQYYCEKCNKPVEVIEPSETESCLCGHELILSERVNNEETKDV
jgi:DNA-directed RNA polymerase subunit RPC12/RpoP